MAKFLFPTKEIDEQLTNHLAVLVSHIMVSHIIVPHMPYFHFNFSDVVSWHIDHPNYKEMSEKSEVVSMYFSLVCKVSYKVFVVDPIRYTSLQ